MAINYQLLLTPLLWVSVASYQIFTREIPNADLVVLPCKPDVPWHGIGHLNPAGSGARNPFGLDFASHHFRWTESLCRMDSDGDGVTNGEELGDPNCVWRKGQTPARNTNISHPGICDPWNSTSCSQSWLDKYCDDTPFVCNATQDKDAKSVNLTLNGATIPQDVSTAMCQTYNVSDIIGEGDYYLIAAEPILDKAKYVNGIRVFGCQDDQPVLPNPVLCKTMDTTKCPDMLADWLLGKQPQCFANDTTKRIGKKGHKILVLPVMFLNVKGDSGVTDHSGMKLHYKEETPAGSPNVRRFIRA